MPKTYTLELTEDELRYLEDVVLHTTIDTSNRADYERLQRLIVRLDNLRTWA